MLNETGDYKIKPILWFQTYGSYVDMWIITRREHEKTKTGGVFGEELWTFIEQSSSVQIV